jgi:hypothetical protein
MTVTEIIEMIENLAWDYEYVGIRVQDGVEFSLGAMEHKSHQFDSRDLFGDQDIDDAEELDGVSAYKINDHTDAACHAERTINFCINHYNHCALLVSDSADYGADEGEIVMHDARVAVIIK